jgi:hypothetical protein
MMTLETLEQLQQQLEQYRAASQDLQLEHYR